MLMAIIEYAMNPGVDEEFTSVISALQPELEQIDGFISADPASSLKHEGLFYEVSYWRDEAALAAWASNHAHLDAKQRGHERLLKWYRIRVGEVQRDWSHGDIPSAIPAAK